MCEIIGVRGELGRGFGRAASRHHVDEDRCSGTMAMAMSMVKVTVMGGKQGQQELVRRRKTSGWLSYADGVDV